MGDTERMRRLCVAMKKSGVEVVEVNLSSKGVFGIDINPRECSSSPERLMDWRRRGRIVFVASKDP